MIGRRSFHRGRGVLHRRRETLWVSGYIPATNVAAGGISYALLTNPFTGYAVVGQPMLQDPTMVRAHIDFGFTNHVIGQNLQVALGLIKMTVGSAGLIAAQIPGPATAGYEDWIGHQWSCIVNQGGTNQFVATGVGSSGSGWDIRSKRKMGDNEALVLVVEAVPSSIDFSAAYRILFNGARK